MDQQNVAIWIAILPAILMASAPLLMATKDTGREKALDNYARKVNLALTPAVRPRVVERIKLFEKSTMIGGGAGLLVGIPLWFLVSRGAASSGWTDTAIPMLLFGALGMAYGPVIASVRHTLRPRNGRRIARPVTPVLSDYVPRLERLSGPVGLAAVGVLLIAGMIMIGTGQLGVPAAEAFSLLWSAGAIVGYGAAVTWLVGVALQRRLLDAGQLAASEQELAWDDALRAMTLRGVATLSFPVSVLASLIIFFEVGMDAVDAPLPIAVLGIAALMIFCTAVAVGVAADVARRPAQHYWRQLWAEQSKASL